MEVILLLSADMDLQSAYERYEDYQSGRGEVLMRQIDAALSILRRHPNLGSPYVGDYRRMLVRDFPYGIFYVAERSRVVVVAILDLRQDPVTIRRRISGNP